MPLFVAYLVYVLINLTDHFNTVHTFLMKKLADDPADVMENLSFGLSVDHVSPLYFLVSLALSGRRWDLNMFFILRPRRPWYRFVLPDG